MLKLPNWGTEPAANSRDHDSGFQRQCTEDRVMSPVLQVQKAANAALEHLSSQSNSLFPYKLREVCCAPDKFASDILSAEVSFEVVQVRGSTPDTACHMQCQNQNPMARSRC